MHTRGLNHPYTIEPNSRHRPRVIAVIQWVEFVLQCGTFNTHPKSKTAAGMCANRRGVTFLMFYGYFKVTLLTR